MTKTWPEYWIEVEADSLHDVLSADHDIVANGANYINNRRKAMGLKPVE
jgi:hypothetical protein